MKNKPIHIQILLDESQSMESIQMLVIDALTSVQRQISEFAQQYPALPIYLTYWTFSGRSFRRHLIRVPLSSALNIADIPYHPDGSTPLYDAMGHLLSEMEMVAGDPSNINAIFYIITDGDENTSKSYSFEAIRKMVSRLEEAGWEFHFLTSDPRARTTAQDMGIQNVALSITHYDLAFEIGNSGRNICAYLDKKVNFYTTDDHV